MKKAKPEDRRDYWKYHCAMFSFEQAGDLVSRLEQMSNRDPLFYPLMIALHVLYARPFRHNKTSRNIDESLIPSDLTNVHNLVLQLRDRIFAHHDKDARVIDNDSGTDLSQLVVRIQNGKIAPGIQTIFPNERQLTNMHRLCRTLYEKCREMGELALKQCISGPPPDGIYLISTDFEGRTPLFTKAELSSR